MKIYTNKPKSNWVSPYTVLEKINFWRKDYDAFAKEPPVFLSKLCSGWFKVANFFNREINYVKIDRWDTWSMDTTLATIILPMLKQLKKDKHGAGYVYDEDVPYGLRSFNSKPKKNDYDTDDFHFMRFDWLLDELIWTFNALHPDTDYEDNYHFGNIDFMWLEVPDKPGFKSMTSSPKDSHRFDRAGHEAYQKRINNGLRLFGKYYQALWD